MSEDVMRRMSIELDNRQGIIHELRATIEQQVQEIARLENELCTAKDQIPPDMEGDSLSVVLIKFKNQLAAREARIDRLQHFEKLSDENYRMYAMVVGQRDEWESKEQAVRKSNAQLQATLAAAEKERDRARLLVMQLGRTELTPVQEYLTVANLSQELVAVMNEVVRLKRVVQTYEREARDGTRTDQAV